MNKNQEQNWRTQKNDALDRALDAALAKYVAEPRAGIEGRILANLRAEQGHAHPRTWWHWGAAAAFAIVVLVIIGLAWTGIRRAPTIANHPPAMKPHVELRVPQTAPTQSPAPESTDKIVTHRSKPGPANPKLDQFPSPQPLSEQEKILVRYVDAYPQHAVLLARARTEALQRDQIEEMQARTSRRPEYEFGRSK